MVAMSIQTQYDAAIFFDNLKSHVSRIGRACGGRVESIHVGGREGEAPIVPFTNQRFREFYLSLGANSYLSFVRQINPDGDAYDPDSGIKENDVREFDNWLRQTEQISGRRALFLDWDRTITIFEGISVGYLRDKQRSFREVFPRVRIEDCLIYLCGGQQRLYMIRDMLQMARDKGVDIYILTNNTACSYRFFEELVDGLFTDGQIRIICAGDAPYYGNKVKAIRPYLVNCSISHHRNRTFRNKTSMRSTTIRRRMFGGRQRKKNF